jgi:hypothetical protein
MATLATTTIVTAARAAGGDFNEGAFSAFADSGNENLLRILGIQRRKTLHAFRASREGGNQLLSVEDLDLLSATDLAPLQSHSAAIGFGQASLNRAVAINANLTAIRLLGLLSASTDCSDGNANCRNVKVDDSQKMARSIDLNSFVKIVRSASAIGRARRARATAGRRRTARAGAAGRRRPRPSRARGRRSA